MPYSVKGYHSTMQGAPALNGLAGSLIGVLDACLLAGGGFGTLTVDSVVIAGGIATVTKSAGHAFPKYAVIEVAGATPSGLNGEKRVLSATATALTFDATGISDQTATGTITVKIPPMGTWTKAFSGTNKAAYRSLAIGGTQLYLRVNDSGDNATDVGKAARVRGYEAMTDVDTGTGLFPTVAQQAEPGPRWPKSDAATSAARPWVLIANDRIFYLWIAPANSAPTSYGFHFFGDPKKLKAADPYLCYLSYALESTTNGFSPYHSWYSRGQGTYGGVVVARSYLATGAAILPAPVIVSPTFASGSVGIGTLAHPCPIDGRTWVAPVVLQELVSGVQTPRAIMSGIYEPLHTANPWSTLTLVEDIEGLPVEVMAGLGMHGLVGSVYHELLVDLNGATW